MGKLRDILIDRVIAEKRFALLLLVLLGIPVAFPVLKFYIPLPVDDPGFRGQLWIFSGGVCIVSASLDWYLTRGKRRAAWLDLALAAVGVVACVTGIRMLTPPSPPKDRLFVAIADFSSFDGKDGQKFTEELYNELSDKVEDNALLMVKKLETAVKELAPDEARKMALKLGRLAGAHIVLWGKVARESGSSQASVAPRITFCSPMQDVELNESDVVGFSRTKPVTLEIAESQYAKNIADVVAFIAGLAYYKAEKWDLAKGEFDRSPIPASTLFVGLCLYNRVQKSSNPEGDLRSATAIFDSLIASPREGDEDVTRAACLNRAAALAALANAAQDQILERFDEAINAYQKAIDCCPKDAAPRDWAMAQAGLGNILTDLALITGDANRQFEEAIRHYQEALEVYSRIPEKDDIEAASAQRNIATAYYHLGVRLNGEGAENSLRKAADACRAALQVYDRKRSPRSWATLSLYLAGTLAELGTRESERGDKDAGERDFRQAVSADRSAVSVFDQKDDDWAEARANLAYVLYRHGASKSDEAGNKLLREAIAESEKALSVYRDDSLDWAIATETRASALSELGSRTPGDNGDAMLQNAIDSFRASLRVRDQSGQNENWAKTHYNLGNSLDILGKRRGGVEGIGLSNDAVTSFNLALTVYDSEPYRERYNEQRQKLRAKIEELTNR